MGIAGTLTLGVVFAATGVAAAFPKLDHSGR
jgi:hypothetical protein